jgi:hypothetical protein
VKILILKMEPLYSPRKYKKGKRRIDWAQWVPVGLVCFVYLYLTAPLVARELQGDPYPLRSKALSGHVKPANNVSALQVAQLKRHLIRNSKYRVLCAHHLDLPEEPTQICVLATAPPGDFIVMANPVIVGDSGGDKEQIVVRWINPPRTPMTSMFVQEDSYALQAALEPFSKAH